LSIRTCPAVSAWHARRGWEGFAVANRAVVVFEVLPNWSIVVPWELLCAVAGMYPDIPEGILSDWYDERGYGQIADALRKPVPQAEPASRKAEHWYESWWARSAERYRRGIKGLE